MIWTSSILTWNWSYDKYAAHHSIWHSFIHLWPCAMKTLLLKYFGTTKLFFFPSWILGSNILSFCRRSKIFSSRNWRVSTKLFKLWERFSASAFVNCTGKIWIGHMQLRIVCTLSKVELELMKKSLPMVSAIQVLNWNKNITCLNNILDKSRTGLVVVPD